MISLAVKNVTKIYHGKKVLNNINMDLNEYGVFLLAGPNGSGKTTLLESIDSLRQIDSGEITCNVSKANIAFLFQQNSLRRLSTVHEELTLVHNLYNTSISVNTIAKKFQLQKYLNTRTISLSGGTKRRILIAMTLMTNANIIILDEPASGLDTFNRKEIWGLIKSYGKDHIVIVSDHYLNQAAEYCDFVYMLHSGKIVQAQSIDSLKQKLNRYFYINVFEDRKKYLVNTMNEHKIAYIIRSTGQNYYFYLHNTNANHTFVRENKYQAYPLTFEDGYLMYTGDDVND